MVSKRFYLLICSTLTLVNSAAWGADAYVRPAANRYSMTFFRSLQAGPVLAAGTELSLFGAARSSIPAGDPNKITIESLTEALIRDGRLLRLNSSGELYLPVRVKSSDPFFVSYVYVPINSLELKDQKLTTRFAVATIAHEADVNLKAERAVILACELAKFSSTNPLGQAILQFEHLDRSLSTIGQSARQHVNVRSTADVLENLRNTCSGMDMQEFLGQLAFYSETHSIPIEILFSLIEMKSGGVCNAVNFNIKKENNSTVGLFQIREDQASINFCSKETQQIDPDDYRFIPARGVFTTQSTSCLENPYGGLQEAVGHLLENYARLNDRKSPSGGNRWRDLSPAQREEWRKTLIGFTAGEESLFAAYSNAKQLGLDAQDMDTRVVVMLLPYLAPETRTQMGLELKRDPSANVSLASISSAITEMRAIAGKESGQQTYIPAVARWETWVDENPEKLVSPRPTGAGIRFRFARGTPKSRGHRCITEPMAYWDETGGTKYFSGNYDRLPPDPKQKISRSLAEALDKHFARCAETGVRAAGILGPLEGLHIRNAGIIGDSNHTSRSLHSTARAIDIKSIQAVVGGREYLFVQARASNDSTSADRKFMDGFRKCWADTMTADPPEGYGCPAEEDRRNPRERRLDREGSIGWEDSDHRHHLHLSLPYCADYSSGVRSCFNGK